MNIFEIDKAILNLIDEETGEIEDIDALEELQMERDRKVDNVACWIKDLEYQNTSIKAEQANLMERRKHNERTIESLKGYLDRALCGSKFESARCKISWRKSTTLEVDDGAEVPEEFFKVKLELNKSELKKAVKDGLEVNGVALVNKKNIQIK